MSSNGGDLVSQYNKIISGFESSRFSQQIFEGFLKAAGEAGLNTANPKTPVRTGNLQRGNQYEVQGYTLRFHNDVEYAPEVNYGSSNRPPRLFFDAGIEAIQQTLQEQLKKL